MAELLASSTAQTDSADFTLASGQTATLYLKDAAGESVDAHANVAIQIKSGLEYFTIGSLNGARPCMVLDAVGTFRVRKFAAPVAFGVDRD